MLEEKLQCRGDQVDCSAGQHQDEGEDRNGGEDDAFQFMVVGFQVGA